MATLTLVHADVQAGPCVPVQLPVKQQGGATHNFGHARLPLCGSAIGRLSSTTGLLRSGGSAAQIFVDHLNQLALADRADLGRLHLPILE